jgi:hypothetical protein
VRQEHEKGGAGPELAVHLDTPAGILDHALDHVEADARALDVVVEALKHSEQARQVSGGEAEAVVVHLQHGIAGAHVGAHVHVGRAVGRAVLNGVAEQVVDDAAQVFFGEVNGRRSGDFDHQLGAGFLQQEHQVLAHVLYHSA